MKQLTFEYNVAGSWADPVVTKLGKHAVDDSKAENQIPVKAE